MSGNRADECLTLAEAAVRLAMNLGYLRRVSVRKKHGIEEINHPFCLDDRITFVSRSSVEAAAEAVEYTRSLRARTKKVELASTSSTFSKFQ